MNAAEPISVTLLGISIEVNSKDPPNALYAMYFTVSGMVNSLTKVYKNASSPIPVT